MRRLTLTEFKTSWAVALSPDERDAVPRAARTRIRAGSEIYAIHDEAAGSEKSHVLASATRDVKAPVAPRIESTQQSRDLARCDGRERTRALSPRLRVRLLRGSAAVHGRKPRTVSIVGQRRDIGEKVGRGHDADERSRFDHRQTSDAVRAHQRRRGLYRHLGSGGDHWMMGQALDVQQRQMLAPLGVADLDGQSGEIAAASTSR